MENIKYLYGKKAILSELIEGTGSLRLCDIRHYERIENEKMRDKEDRKIYEYEPGMVEICVNGFVIPKEDIVSNIKMELQTRLCYCICFSNKKDDPELYERFEADVCIEFDIGKLVEFLEFVFPKDKGCKTEHKSVCYYGVNPDFAHTSYHNNAFMKNRFFCVEDEYRVATFFPHDENTVLIKKEQKLDLLKECRCLPENFSSCQCYFMYVDNGLDSKFKSYISAVYERKLENV